MRKTLLAALLLLPLAAQAEDFIRYYSPGGTTFTGGAITSALAAPAADNCAAVPYSFTGDTNTGLCTSAADTFNLYTAGASRLSGNSSALTATVKIQTIAGAAGTPAISGSTDADSGIAFDIVAKNTSVVVDGAEKLRVGSTVNTVGLQGFVDNTYDLGLSGTEWRTLYLEQSTAGGSSKTLTDATATAFARVTVTATINASSYTAGNLLFVIRCSDGTNEATQSGSVKYACHNRGDTETCSFSTPDFVTLGDGTASLGTPAFDSNSAVANTVDLRVSSDCTGITASTFTMFFRPDTVKGLNTWTPQ